MAKPTVVHNTFVIERSYPKPPERVFAAFADPAKKRRWYAAEEHRDVDEFKLDFRVGGVERLRCRFKEGTRFPGVALAYDTRFEDIVPNRRIVTSSTMDFADKRVSASLITFEFLETGKGTDLILTHQGTFLEGSDGPQIREAGWRGLLDLLEQEVTR